MGVYLYGCGGHAKVILDILTQQKRVITAFVDDNPPFENKKIHGIPIYHSAEILGNPTPNSQWIIGIGNNLIREQIAKKLASLGYSFTTAIHPSAQVGLGVYIAPGTVVMANAVINCDTKIGQHVIINTGATVDHDCIVSDYCHIAPGCSICGQVTLNKSLLVGVGSSVCPGIEIGQETTCGAGSVVTKSLPSNCLAYGCPAQVIQKNYSQ